MRAFLILIFFDLAVLGYSQGSLFKNYSVSEGLISNTVYFVFQDAQKRIWAGTDAGISFYDGFEWKSISEKEGLSDNVVLQLHQDSQGRIWLLTENGEPSFIDSIVHNPSNTPFLRNINPKCYLYGFYEDEMGTIWIGSHYKGIYSVDKNNEVNHYLWPTSGRLHKSYEFASFKGDLRILTSLGVRHLDKNKTITSIGATLAEQLDNLHGTKIDSFFVVGNNRDILLLDFNGTLHGKDENITEENIIHISQMDSSHVWVGTMDGYYEYNFVDKSLKGPILKGQSITSLSYDHEGGIWVSTLDNGLLYNGHPSSEYITGSESLPNNKVESLFYLNGLVWLGFKNGYFGNVQDNRVIIGKNSRVVGEGKLTDAEFFNDKIYLAQGDLICIDETDTIIYDLYTREFACIDSGIYIANYAGVHFIPWQDLDQLGHPGGSVVRNNLSKSKYVAFEGNCRAIELIGSELWIGTTEGAFRLSNTVSRMLPQSEITDIETYNGTIWLSTLGNGVYQYMNNRFTHIHGENVNCKKLYADAQGNIWAITNKGIAVLYSQGGKKMLHTYDESNGISLPISSMLVLEKDIWLAGPRGLQKLKIDKLNAPLPSLELEIYTEDGVIKDSEELHTTYNNNAFSFHLVSCTYRQKPQFYYRLNKDDSWRSVGGNELTLEAMEPGHYTIQMKSEGLGGKSSSIRTFYITISPPFWRTWAFKIAVACIIIILIYSMFRLRVLQYNKETVKETFQLIRQRIKKEHFIVVKDVKNGALTKLLINEILWIKGADNYVEITLMKSQITVRSTMKAILMQLNDKGKFLRIHQSYIVNPARVTGISATMVFIGENSFPIGRTYAPKVKELKKLLKKTLKTKKAHK